MAYNPFDFFRRNQKLFFGGLTILVMFMFILSFGRGDFFSWFPQWIAKFQTHGDTMAVIDGSTIKESQLRDLATERNLANGYMIQAANKALEASAKAAEKEVEGADPNLRGQLGAYLQLFSQAVQLRRSDPDDLAFVRSQLEQRAYELVKMEKETPKKDDKDRAKAVRVFGGQVLNELARRAAGDRGESGVYFANQPNRNERDRLEFVLWKKKADQLGIRYTHDDVARLVDLEFPTASVTPDDLKTLAEDVAGKSGKKKSDLYDALADEFRVRAAQTAVLGLNAVRSTALNTAGTTEQRYEHFVKETTATKYTFLTIPVEAYLSQVQGEPTEAELTEIFNKRNSTDPDPASPNPGIREPRKVGVQWVEVSGNEDYYRTLAAQRSEAFKKAQASAAAQAVLGPTVAPPPAVYTYDDYLKAQAAVVSFRQTRTANPGNPTLTFSAEVNVDLMRALTGGAAGDAYRTQLIAKGGWNTSPVARSEQDQLLDAELAQPQLAAALAGLTVGGAATFAPVGAADVAVVEAAYRQSREKRVVASVRAFQFPTLPGLAGLTEAIGGAVSEQAGSPAPLPQAVVQPVLDRQTAEQMRVVVATEDVQAFEKELTRITGQKFEAPKGADKPTIEKGEREHKAKVTKEAAEYVTKWLGERKLKAGGTTEPRTVHALADDPGLAPLVALDKGLQDLFTGKLKNSRAATAFGQSFVQDDPIPPALRRQLGGRIPSQIKPAVGLYQVRIYDPSSRASERQEYGLEVPGGMFGGGGLQVSATAPLTLVWRTAEVEAVRPLSLTSDKTAREKCRAIWKMNKARELARKAADEAAATIAKAGANEIQVDQFAADALAQLKKPFEKEPVADRFQLYRQEPAFSAAKLLVDTRFISTEFPPLVVPFNPQHRSVVYETEKMREELMANKDKPVGTTFVFTDQPQGTLYLTVVAAREEKGPQVFRDNVLYPKSSHTPMQGFMPLGPDVMAPRFAGYVSDADRKTAVALLKAEFNYKNENPKLDEKRE